MFDEQYRINSALSYVVKLSKNNPNITTKPLDVYRWYQDYIKQYIKFDWLPTQESKLFDDFEEFYQANPLKAKIRTELFIKMLCEKLQQKKFSLNKTMQVEAQFSVLQQLFKLNDLEIDLLKVTLLRAIDPMFEQFVDITYSQESHQQKLAKMYCHCLNITFKKFKQLIHINSRLIEKKLIETSYNFSDINCTDLLVNILNYPFRSEKELKQIVLKMPLTSKLDWQDFDYIENTELVRALFRQINNKPTCGINILLHGDVGTGKTEFANVLCKTTDFQLFSIDDHMNLFNSSNRFDTLQIIQTILGPTTNTCLLVDEADDILQQHFFTQKRINKCMINLALENNSSPIIWIMNDISYLESAYLRRFNYIIEFTHPTLSTRQKIWQNSLNQYQLSLSSTDINYLAHNYRLQPAIIDTVVKTTAMINGKMPQLKQHIHQLQKALNPHFKPPKNQNGVQFIPELVNADIDLIKLTQCLKDAKRVDFSLCLYGVSGSGKSAYAQYLAEQLAMPLIKIQCADLMSAWVGDTEKNIQNAFKIAKDENAILLFDEADSFLQDRVNAKQTWQISQVNQMLTCMEEHNLPFICTTNLMETLDPASLRRFTFKIKYNFLNKQQINLAFELFFNITDIAETNLVTATIGDFKVLEKKIDLLGDKLTADQLISLLQQEQQNKTQPKPQIGFIH